MRAPPEVLVAGDLVALEHADGTPVPGLAPAARQMGAQGAGVIRTRLSSCRPAAADVFRYRGLGHLAAIGRRAAVVDVRGWRFSGLPARRLWPAAHVYFLIGLGRRLAVLVNGDWACWTYQGRASILIGPAETTRRDGPRA